MSNKMLQKVIKNASVFRNNMKTKYGFQVPNNHQDAIALDSKAGTEKWKEAAATKIKTLMDYETFIDLGKDALPPEGYQKIVYRMIYDVKHDGRHRGRLVAGGHQTPNPVDGSYLGVISLRGICLVIAIAVLNKLKVWSTDVSSAYLEATTKEKVYIVAGDEFGEMKGHTLIIDKALYGLKTSGLHWHEKLADVLRDMGFTQCRAEPDIWMKKMEDHYEYIAVYVDDLCIVSKHPEKILEALEKDHKLKLKGSGPIEYHLGCDFYKDDDNTLCIAPKKYIDKLCDKYIPTFGDKPKGYNTPLEKNDHPEVDELALLDADGITLYQSMIGALQWAVSLG
jgi:Reverse transcriptase (RNA-dependent DNA polymerase)